MIYIINIYFIISFWLTQQNQTKTHSPRYFNCVLVSCGHLFVVLCCILHRKVHLKCVHCCVFNPKRFISRSENKTNWTKHFCWFQNEKKWIDLAEHHSTLSLSLTMCHGLFLCRFQSVYKHYANYYLNSILSLNCFAGVFQCVCLSRAVCVCVWVNFSLCMTLCVLVGWFFYHL